MSLRSWWKAFSERHVIADGPEGWDLYIFPGGKVGEARTRRAAIDWTAKRAWTEGERRAINIDTGEHIVNGHPI